MSVSRRCFLGALGSALALPHLAQAGGTPIRFVASDNYVPFSYFEDGRMQGLTVESVRHVGTGAGLDFEFYGMPWARGLQLIRMGDLDACLAYPTDERRGFLNFVETPLIADRAGVVHRVRDPRVRSSMSIADIGALRLGTFIGSTWVQTLFPDRKVTTTGNQDSVVRMIAADRLDAYIESEIVARNKIRESGFPAALAFTPIDALPTATYCFGLRKDYTGGPAVLEAFAKSLARADRAGELARLQAHFGAPRS